MRKTLIVGFGRSGRDLHLHCLRKLQHAASNGTPLREVGVVEVGPAALRAREVPGIEVFGSVAEARRCFDEETVVHVCTPPSTHFAVIREAARHGYTRLIVEKPLVARVTDLPALRALVGEHRLDLFVVANWLSSALTARLLSVLETPPDRAWSRLTISQLKPRFTRSLSHSGEETVFDVEIPHQMALSVLFGGRSLAVRRVDCSDMVVNGSRLAHMGQATITLEDARGRVIVVHSDLTSPIRQRSVEVQFTDGARVVGYYPCTEADSYSQLLTFHDGADRPSRRELLPDDPLSAFIHEVYGYFERDGRRPASDIDFNAAVVATIGRAKTACGLLA